MILAVCANPSVDSFWSIQTLEKKTANRSQKESYYPGGKGIHAAFALRELGEEVTLLGIWGGQTGAWLKKKCENKGITVIGPSTEQWNRFCLTFQSDSDWNETELLGHGPDIDKKTAEAFGSAYTHCIARDKPKAVMMCGSVPAGLDENIYSRFINHAKQFDILTFADASGRLLRQTLDAHPFSVHINEQEGREICNLDHPADMARWLRQFCEVAAVTAGADGLYLSIDKLLFNAYYRIEPSKIISTIGAGDCLFAGLCFAVLNHEDPKTRAKFAAACGAANCIHPSLGMLKKEDAEALVNNIQLEKLMV